MELQDWQRSRSVSREKSVGEELSVDATLFPEVLCILVVVLGKLKHTGKIDSQRLRVSMWRGCIYKKQQTVEKGRERIIVEPK
jgi:hypothetical protein